MAELISWFFYPLLLLGISFSLNPFPVLLNFLMFIASSCSGALHWQGCVRVPNWPDCVCLLLQPYSIYLVCLAKPSLLSAHCPISLPVWGVLPNCVIFPTRGGW